MFSDTQVRLGIFIIVLFTMALLEYSWPKRNQKVGRLIRWPRNLGITLLGTLLVRFMGPLTAGAVAIWASKQNIGLFNLANTPYMISFPMVLIVFDMLIYWQHVLFHRIPFFWRFHKIHHIDQELDVTSGIRFHPVEIVFSMLIKSLAVLVLGAPFWSILAFEVLLNASAMFNHANVRLPEPVDRILRKLIVTPDMHRVHHSVIPKETHSNFGFNLAIWDRIFGTYRDQPEAGHENMTLGLPSHQDAQKTTLLKMLVLPFRRR